MLVLCVFGAACGKGGTSAPSTDASPPAVRGPEIGVGDHTAASVVLTEIATKSAKLSMPRDLAFNPLRPDELWVVNDGDDSIVIVHDASTDGRTTERRKDGDAQHFMPKPSSIDFGADETTFGVPGTFGTCGESRNAIAGDNDFMGPVLWSSDLSIFAAKNPNQLGSHLDMLHDSPLCMGIAHQEKNVYWAFGGLNSEIVRYDFGKDNNVGQDDHSDGTALHYVTGHVKYVKGVPSHLFFHAADAMLYIADTGNGRILRLDTTTGTPGKSRLKLEPMGTCMNMDNAALSEIVPGGTLVAPSGLEIRNELLYVSDNATSRITVFTLDGEQVNYLDTGLPQGSLSGMAFGLDGKLYVVDMVGERVLRIDVPPR